MINFDSFKLVLFICLAALLCFVNAGLVQAYDDQDHGYSYEESALTVAMTASFVSETELDIYGKISNYIEGKLDVKTNFLTDLSYSVFNSMVEAGVDDSLFNNVRKWHQMAVDADFMEIQ